MYNFFELPCIVWCRVFCSFLAVFLECYTLDKGSILWYIDMSDLLWFIRNKLAKLFANPPL